jgi:hypothetical protein
VELSAPKEIPVHVAGRALDTAGQPVKGANVLLITVSRERSIVAVTKTDPTGN